MRVVKSYVREEYEIEKFERASKEVEKDFTMNNILKIGISQGDTNGIGWEIILKILLFLLNFSYFFYMRTGL